MNLFRFNETAVMRAASRGHVEVLELLLSSGANPDAVEGEDYTVLSMVVRDRDVDAIKVLLKYNANPDILNVEGRTPLMWAAELSGAETVMILLDVGASVAQGTIDPSREEDETVDEHSNASEETALCWLFLTLNAKEVFHL